MPKSVRPNPAHRARDPRMSTSLISEQKHSGPSVVLLRSEALQQILTSAGPEPKIIRDGIDAGAPGNPDLERG